MKYDWYNENSRIFMSRGYFSSENETIEDKIISIAREVGKEFNSDEIAQYVKDYLEEGYYVAPTPFWSNYGTNRGSAISCFNSHFPDDMMGIISAVAEVGAMCKIGGGTSGYYGSLRPAGAKVASGGKANGPMYYMELSVDMKEHVNQNNVRRGEHAAFMNIDNPEIDDFISINTEGHKFQRLPFGVCVSNQWLEDMKNGDVNKQDVWAKVLDTKLRTGYPYIFFTDNVNNGTVDVYKDKNYKILSTNMCTEIMLPSNDEESFVCDLLAINAIKIPEMRERGIFEHVVKIAVYIADAMLSDFIRKYKNNNLLVRAVRFAERHRAIGLGLSGYHSLLQSLNIPFESIDAQILNKTIFKELNEYAYAASKEMAEIYGKPDVLKEDKYDRRHTCLIAVAPNTSSSTIMGQQSQSIEPYTSNYYIKKTAKLRLTVKNPYLAKVLDTYGRNDNDTWNSILRNSGSVQHLSFLTDHEKNVFKTFAEINQYEILTQAAQRQVYIDQGQSLNFMVLESTTLKELNKLILTANEMGIKSIYYLITTNAAQEFIKTLTCESCAG